MPGHRHLLDPAMRVGGRDAEDLVDGRHDVGHVGELIPLGSGSVAEASRPVNDHRHMHAALVGERLVPTERRVAALGPPPRIVRVAARPAYVVDPLDCFVGRLLDALEVLHLVHRAGRPSLLGGAVVGQEHQNRVV